MGGWGGGEGGREGKKNINNSMSHRVYLGIEGTNANCPNFGGAMRKTT